MSDLEIYMQAWLIKQMLPDAEEWDIDRMFNKFLEYKKDFPYNIVAVLHSPPPMRYQMMRWLSEKGFSQGAIAKMLGVSQPTVSQGIARGHENYYSGKSYKNRELKRRREAIQEYNQKQGMK